MSYTVRVFTDSTSSQTTWIADQTFDTPEEAMLNIYGMGNHGDDPVENSTRLIVWEETQGGWALYDPAGICVNSNDPALMGTTMAAENADPAYTRTLRLHTIQGIPIGTTSTHTTV